MLGNVFVAIIWVLWCMHICVHICACRLVSVYAFVRVYIFVYLGVYESMCVCSQQSLWSLWDLTFQKSALGPLLQGLATRGCWPVVGRHWHHNQVGAASS